MATFSGTALEEWDATGTFRVEVELAAADVTEPIGIFAVSTPVPTLVDGVPQ